MGRRPQPRLRAPLFLSLRNYEPACEPHSWRTVNRMRVAHLIQGLHYGGMERVLNEMVGALSSRDIEMHVIVVEGFGPFAHGLHEVAVLHRLPPMSKASLYYPRA